MPWSRSRPGGANAQAKYRTKAHRQARAAMAAQLKRDGYLTCVQPVCLLHSRAILPGMRWCAGHDDTGTTYIGPVHFRCNVVDGAKRARARQDASPLRW